MSITFVPAVFVAAEENVGAVESLRLRAFINTSFPVYPVTYETFPLLSTLRRWVPAL